MWRPAVMVLTCLSLLIAMPGTGIAKRPAIGPGRPIFPKPERTDAELFDKAVRIQKRMWKHVSPEGLLVHDHRVDATPDELSYDALKLSDIGIWHGCYTAAMACRYHVTGDPEALTQLRVLAQGMAILSDVTGYGGLARNVGRLPEGVKRPKNVVPSKNIPGLAYRSDVSGDQVAGWTLGWACITKFVDDAELLALARRELDAISRHLRKNKMKLKDHRGKTTKHGDHEKSVFGLGLFNKGMTAANGFAPIVVGDHIDAGRRSAGILRWAEKKGYREALDDMWSGLRVHMSASNCNMGAVALCAIRLRSTDGKTLSHAKNGLKILRKSTLGWWNAGIAACCLLGGASDKYLLDEIRVVLHMMSEREIPKANRIKRITRNRPATIRERGVTDWSWKSTVDQMRIELPDAPLDTKTYCRADWLFAYWLTRAAGRLTPKTGPGAAGAVTMGIEVPAWAQALAARPLPTTDTR